MEYIKDKPYIFISYAHKDNATVLPILKLMREYNINIWYDDGIEAGSEWPDYIAQKILGCNRFLCFISENYPASQNCKRELNFAIAEKKEVLSIYLKEEINLPAGMRMQLGSYQSLFYNRFKSPDDFGKFIANENFVHSCIVGQKKTEPSPNQKTPAPQSPKQTGNSADKQKKASTKKQKDIKPHIGKRIIVLIIFSILAYRLYNLIYYAYPVIDSDLEYTYTVSSIAIGLGVLFKGLLLWVSGCKNNTRFAYTMFILITIMTDMIINYYVCEWAYKISFMFHILSAAAIVLVNVVINFIETIAYCIIDE